MCSDDGERLWSRELGNIEPLAVHWVEEHKFVLLHNDILLLNHDLGLAMVRINKICIDGCIPSEESCRLASTS
jgi:hypothetical protein